MKKRVLTIRSTVLLATGFIMFSQLDEQIVLASEEMKLAKNQLSTFVENDEAKEKITKDDIAVKISGETVTAKSELEKNVNPSIKTWDGAFYVDKDGNRAVNQWVLDNTGNWYFVNENGQCVTNTWKGLYYLKNNGQMAQNEWLWDKNYQSWFFLNEDGTYAQNKWVGSYYLKQ